MWKKKNQKLLQKKLNQNRKFKKLNKQKNRQLRQLLPLPLKLLLFLLKLLLKHQWMKNLRHNIRNCLVLRLPDKKLICLNSINLKRKRKNQKFNQDLLRNQVVRMTQIKIKEKEFNLNRELLEARIPEIHKEVRLVRVKQSDRVSTKVLALQLLPKLSQRKKKYKNKSVKP